MEINRLRDGNFSVPPGHMHTSLLGTFSIGKEILLKGAKISHI